MRIFRFAAFHEKYRPIEKECLFHLHQMPNVMNLPLFLIQVMFGRNESCVIKIFINELSKEALCRINI